MTASIEDRPASSPDGSAADSLEIAYESTLDDATAAQLQLVRELKNVRHGSRGIVLAIAALLALVLFLSLPGRAWLTGPIAAIVAAVFGLLFSVLLRRSLERRIRRLCAEQRQTGDPIATRVEIDTRGIHHHARGVHVSLDWEVVREIERLPGHLKIAGKGAGLIMIPISAFADLEAAGAFLDRARALRSTAAGRNPAHYLCPSCGYDLFGGAGTVCPECGAGAETAGGSDSCTGMTDGPQ